ncbi:MAG: 30S ribosomal protein S19e [Halodesulfurarchaeum sp.]|nr:30S ribosomal protein S19e [Halodesulfurarchaeum sp.]
MATLYDAPADELIEALAEELSERLDAPDWATYTKTGASRELPPEQADFWATRTASVLRKVAMNAPIGVERLSTAYGGTKDGSNRYQVAPSKRSDGSQKILREILQDLEDEGLIMTRDGEGRDITPEGQQLLDETAGEVIEALDDPELERYA